MRQRNYSRNDVLELHAEKYSLRQQLYQHVLSPESNADPTIKESILENLRTTNEKLQSVVSRPGPHPKTNSLLDVCWKETRANLVQLTGNSNDANNSNDLHNSSNSLDTKTAEEDKIRFLKLKSEKHLLRQKFYQHVLSPTTSPVHRPEEHFRKSLIAKFSDTNKMLCASVPELDETEGKSMLPALTLTSTPK